MAAPFLTPLVGGINSLVGPLAAEEIKLLCSVESEVEKLKNTISLIEKWLPHAEGRQGSDPATKVLLERLGDVLFDAEDLLDALSTEALQREEAAKKVFMFFTKLNQLTFRCKVAHKIKEIRGKLRAIKDDKELQLDEPPVETSVMGWERDDYSYINVEVVIGRDADKEAIIGLMDTKVEENVLIIPIVGIGGLGKTALARLVYEDEKINEKKFDPKIWLCVSNNFEVKIIVKRIVEYVTKKKPKTDEMGILEEDLRKAMDERKYLLVLDDVWDHNHGKWSALVKLLMNGAKGSAILITTRDRKVANTIREVRDRIIPEVKDRTIHLFKPHPLRGLDEKESWNLFKMNAFKEGQEPENSNMVEIGREILKKCAGVPLVVKVVGSLLLDCSEKEWLDLKDKELVEIDDENKEAKILETLKLSYYKLPPHLKSCFTYCSLFPKDYLINKSQLIKLWIAQGFIQGNRCLEEVGNKNFKDLLRKSFFQEVEINEFGEIIGCKMHDLMHDVAVSEVGSLISIVDFENENIFVKTRHIAVYDDIKFSSIETTKLQRAKKIRTFFCPGEFYFKGEIDCAAIFSSNKFLRALELSSRKLKSVPCSINELIHLRYLDFSSNEEIKKLPDSITNLINLQTLRLSHCELLEELPIDIKKLVNLRHLEINGCARLKYMPRGLGQLKKLQFLPLFVVDSGSFSRHSGGLNELNGLNEMSGVLQIKNMSHANGIASDYIAANLKEKQFLNSLSLWWCTEGNVNDSNDDMALEGFQPHPDLKQLDLQNYWGSRLSSWLSSLKNLVELALSDCKKCQYLPPLSQLPCLKRLRLSGMDEMQYISCDNKNEFSSSLALKPFFPLLEEIVLQSCPNLKGWWGTNSSLKFDGDGDNSLEEATIAPMTEYHFNASFLCLSRLCIGDCPMLTSMPTCPHLKELYLYKVNLKLLQQKMMISASTARTNSSSAPLSKLKIMLLDSIMDLEILEEEWLQNLTSLEDLRIIHCKNLKSLSREIQYLTSLKYLDISYPSELELYDDEDGMQWQSLKGLLSLSLTGILKLVSLPSGLQHVTTLQELRILNCENLIAIPEWIQNFKSLEILSIIGSHKLTSLPKGIQILSLRQLEVIRCPNLLQRCKKTGEDWPKIAHIPNLHLK